MENLSLIDVNKPEKLKSTLNELINYKNNAQEIPEITAKKLGLGNVDNTRDIDKPLSTAQQEYVDNENEKDVKLKSENLQEIDSDIMLGAGKTLYLKRGNDTRQEAVGITNDEGYEHLNVGSASVPLRLKHSTADINNVIVSKNPKVQITDEHGSVTEEEVAFISNIGGAVENKLDKDVLEGAETANGVVTAVGENYVSDTNVDEFGLRISVRNISTGALISETIIPFKLASILSRGLMSKEDVATLNNLVTKVASMDGRTSRYIYTDSKNPTAEEIDAFARVYGNEAPYSGVAVVVDKTYHIWHYYENDDIGWKDDGADTVTQATNTTLGIVLGSTADGKITIETDGSMSVVGWDALVAKVNSLQDTATTRDEVQTMIDTAIANSITQAMEGSY